MAKTAGKRRRRVPPRERFSGKERVFDLEQAFADLPAESTLRQGHMQKALYRLGPTTTAIFTFERGGRIDRHRLDGESIMHVLSGCLEIRTPRGTRELGPGEMMLLNPGVPHDLTARRATRMLMTFVLKDSPGGGTRARR